MSINTTALKSALKSLNLPIGKQVRYESIAKALNFVPKKIVKGKETKQALKVGSQKYKEAVYNELIRRKQQKGIVKKEQKVELIEKKEPVKKSKKLVESLMQKFFQKYSFEYDGIGNEEEFYNAVKSEVDAIGGDANFVTIYFKDLNAPKSKNIVGRNIGASYLDTFEDFMEEINNIKEGQYGSDPLDSSNYTPIYSDFKIATTAFNPTANGSSEDMMFKVKGIVSKEKLCVYESLLACGYKSMDYFVYPQQLRDINKLVWLIKEKELPIAVIANAFTINKPSIEIINRDKTKITIKDKKRERMYVSGKVMKDDIDLVYICGDETAKHFIIYDEINQHADYCIGKPKLLDEVYLTFGNNIIMNEKIQFTCKEMRKMTKVDTGVPIEFVFFDYETIIDFNMSSCMKPYSLSILTLTSKQLDLLEEADFDKKEDVVKIIRGNCCKTFLGYDCNEKFIEWFLEYQLNKTLIFVGFNNTNFDNFLLLEGMLKYRDEHHMCELNVSDIFFNGSQLLNFKINGRHNTFDIRKHLMGSLKKNCKDFKINCCAKKEFNHDHAQELNDNDKLIEYITGNEELKEYNEYDVLATAVLYKRYVNALSNIPATEKYANNIFDTKTIGSLIYKVFSDNKTKMKFDLPKLDYETYADLQKSKIAGRVEMFNGVQKVQERLVSTDVCSLYPFVMSILNCYYPCGKEIVKVDEYKGDDELGFYYCDIDQSCLKHMNLPNIYAKKSDIENDWAYDGVLENYLISNVMIGLLRKFNCNVVIKNGFVFQEKKKSCEMFGFLLDFMKEKNKQDTLKQDGDQSYNPALRETLKLLMNSLSGKVIEGLHTEKTIDIDSVAEYMNIKEKASSINFINSIGGKLFVTYEVNEEDIIKQQRPIYLGVLIYDYAKRYMYENSYSKIGKAGLLYTDTDASKFRYSDFVNWKSWIDTNNVKVPHWEEVELVDERYKNHKIYQEGSKVFGSFEDELEDAVGDDYLFYCLEKKSWLYAYLKDGKWKAKYRFKGLNGSAQMLTLNEPFIGNRVINHTNGTQEVKFFVKPESEYDVYKYYLDHKQNNIENGNEIKFFERIYTTGTAYVMCNSFRKIVKNSCRNVDVEDETSHNNLMNKIQVNYNVKKIQIKSIVNV